MQLTAALVRRVQYGWTVLLLARLARLARRHLARRYLVRGFVSANKSNVNMQHIKRGQRIISIFVLLWWVKFCCVEQKHRTIMPSSRSRSPSPKKKIKRKSPSAVSTVALMRENRKLKEQVKELKATVLRLNKQISKMNKQFRHSFFAQRTGASLPRGEYY